MKLEKEPTMVTEDLQSFEKEQWQVAMRKKIESIQSNEVWDLVELPANRKPVGSKWVLKRKIKADETRHLEECL